MAFDPSIVNFLTVGDFSDPSYGIPESQRLVTAANTGLYFQNAGGGSTYTLNTSGNLSNIMALQNSSTYGLVISVPQGDGGLITRQLEDSSSITITNRTGSGGNPSISVVPSSTLQLTQYKVNGTNAGAAHSILNFISGSNVGLSFVDTGTQTNLTISTTLPSGALVSDPFITYTASSNLTDAQNIGLLSTGLLKNTVSAGSATLSTAVAGTDYQAPSSYLTEIAGLSPTNGSLLYYTGNTWDLLAPGTIGDVLTVTGATSVSYTNASAVLADWSDYPALQNVDFNNFKGVNVATPTAGTDIATKAYADSIVGGAPLGAYYVTTQANGTLTNEVNLGLLTTGFVYSTVSAGVSTVSIIDPTTIPTISGANNFTGTNTFNSHLPTSTLTPTLSTELVTKAFTDATYDPIGSASALLSANNAWTGTNSYNTSLPTSTLTPTSSTQLITKAYGDATYVASSGAPSLAGNNAWTGTNSYNTNLPTSTQTPTSSTQLVTKAFTDATYDPIGSATALLASNNTWTGTNAFNTSLPTSTLTPTSSTQLITKAYGDATYATIAGEVTLGGTNAWTGTNSYDVNLPTSTQTPTSGTQLITKSYADGAYGALAGTNAWTGTNTFNTSLPTSTQSVTSSSQLTTKSYVDNQVTSQLANYLPITKLFVTTTDATPTVLVNYTLTLSNATYTFYGAAGGWSSNTSGASGAQFFFTATNNGGTPILIDSNPWLITNLGDPGLSYTVSLSGFNLQIIVTGLPGTTIHWYTNFSTLVTT